MMWNNQLIETYKRYLIINASYSVSENEAREDDGYVLSFLSNWKAGKSYFVIFDARNISKGFVFKTAIILFCFFFFYFIELSFSISRADLQIKIICRSTFWIAWYLRGWACVRTK